MMLCDPYAYPCENSAEAPHSAFIAADAAGAAYGAIKGIHLFAYSAVLYDPRGSSWHERQIALAAIGAFSLLATAYTSYYFCKKSELILEAIRKPQSPNERVVKAKLLADWTSYTIAAIAYGQLTGDIKIHDLRILAVKISKIAFLISFGLLIGWAYSLNAWNWKTTVSFSVSLISFIYLLASKSLPKISERANGLLVESVESAEMNCSPAISREGLELLPILPHQSH